MTRGEAFALGGLAAVAIGLLAAGAKLSPGSSFKVPVSQSADWAPFTPPPGRPVVGPDQLVGGYVLAPHRYPAACGSDITALMHGGWSTAALPNDTDMLWLSAPPSEDTL